MSPPLPRTLDVARSLASTLAQQGRGIATRPAGRQPAEPLELYDMEGCPFCRLVREALTDLDLDVLIYPCPKGGDRYRPLVERLGGKQLFPYLMDPNTGVDLYESADIIDYLYREYGGRPAPAAWRLRTLRTASSFAGQGTVDSLFLRGQPVRAAGARTPVRAAAAVPGAPVRAGSMAGLAVAAGARGA